MSRIARVAVASVAMVMLVVSVGRASVLDQVPGEALVVLKVTNLKGASDKLSRFATDLGVAAFAPPLADPLAFVTEQLGARNGVDTNGDLAFVFVDPEAVGGSEEDALMVLVPVTDYQAFIGNYADAQTEGDITTFTFPDMGATAHASKWGNFAVLSPQKQVHALKPTGFKAPAVSAKELGKDIVLLANFRNLRGKLQPMLAEGRAEISSTIEEELGKEAPEMEKFLPTIKLGVNRLLDMADSYLRDSEAATVAINFVPEGLNIAVVSEFAPSTYLGDVVAAGKNTTSTFTAGLPAGKYLVYGGTEGDPVAAAKLIDDLCAPVLAELKKTGGEEAASIDRMYTHFLNYVKATRGQTAGLMSPQGEFGESALLQAVNIYTGDAAKMKESYFALMEGQADVMRAFGLPADQVNYVINRGARTVDGVTFDQIKGDFKFDANSPDAAQAEQMMKLLYGPEGMNFYVAELASDKLIQVFGLSDEAISQALAAAKSGKDSLGGLPQVKVVAAQLPANKAGVLYIAIDEWLNTGLNVAKQFGFGMNVQIQPDLPPLGVSVATEGNAIRIDSHAPTQLISQLIAAGFQIGMQMNQGGPRGGGPGGL